MGLLALVLVLALHAPLHAVRRLHTVQVLLLLSSLPPLLLLLHWEPMPPWATSRAVVWWLPHAIAVACSSMERTQQKPPSHGMHDHALGGCFNDSAGEVATHAHKKATG